MIKALGNLLERTMDVARRAPQLISAPDSYRRTGLAPTKDTKEQLNSYDSWTFAAVDLISSRLAEQRMKLMLQRPNTATAERVLRHPFIELMKKPCPAMLRFEFVKLHGIFLDLTGNSYWYVVTDGFGIPRELWLLPPDRVWPVPDPDNFLAGYLYYPPGSSEPVRFGVNDIIHFKYPSPTNFYLGWSPLRAAAYAYDINLYTHVYERSFFKEGARFDFALQTDADLTDDQVARVYQLWLKSHQGVDKAWRPAILSGGLKAVALNQANKDFEFANLAGWTKDEILGIFKVPEAMLGHGAQVNRASTDAFEVIFNRNCIVPRMIMFEEGMEEGLLNRYPGQAGGLEFDLMFDSPVPPDREMELKEEESRLSNKVIEANHVRSKIGLEPKPWGEVPWGQVQDAPVTNLMENKPASAQPKQGTEPTGAKPPAETPPPPKPKKSTTEIGDFAEKIDPLFDSAEVVASSAIRALFRDQEKRQVQLIAENYEKEAGSGVTRDPTIVDRLLLYFDAEIKATVAAVEYRFFKIFETAVRVFVRGFGMVNEPQITEARIMTFVAQKTAKFADELNRVTRREIRDTLFDGVKLGETKEQLIGRVHRLFDIYRATRATMAGQTEVAALIGRAALETILANGFLYKEWWTRQDEKVRPTHADAHGQIVPVNQDFHVGGCQMAHPGDPSAPLSETARCRCIPIPRSNPE